MKEPVPHIPKCFLPEKVEEETEGEPANPGSPGKMVLKPMCLCVWTHPKGLFLGDPARPGESVGWLNRN